MTDVSPWATERDAAAVFIVHAECGQVRVNGVAEAVVRARPVNLGVDVAVRDRELPAAFAASLICLQPAVIFVSALVLTGGANTPWRFSRTTKEALASCAAAQGAHGPDMLALRTDTGEGHTSEWLDSSHDVHTPSWHAPLQDSDT
jgi:hypothetical protein